VNTTTTITTEIRTDDRRAMSLTINPAKVLTVLPADDWHEPSPPSRPNPPRVIAIPDGLGGAVIICPFSDHKHFHGWVEGHRVSHCLKGQDVLRLGYVLELVES
jgi:hypothetical protein